MICGFGQTGGFGRGSLTLAYSHELVINEEMSTIASRGYGDGLGGGFVIGLPTVMNFGQPALKARIMPEVMKGDKMICLAITEAFAGSDVQGLQTRAVLSDGWLIPISGGFRFMLIRSVLIRRTALYRKRNQEMDHQRHLFRLLCNRLPHRQRPHHAPHRALLWRRRDQADQDGVFYGCGDGVCDF